MGITNTVDSFLVNQIGMESIPRWLLSGALITAMTAGVVFGRADAESHFCHGLPTGIHSAGSLFLSDPDWNTSMMEVAPDWSAMPAIVWLAIPIIVFSFNHSPIISQFSKEQRQQFAIKPYKNGHDYWRCSDDADGLRDVLRILGSSITVSCRAGDGKRAKHLCSVLPS